MGCASSSSKPPVTERAPKQRGDGAVTGTTALAGNVAGVPVEPASAHVATVAIVRYKLI